MTQNLFENNSESSSTDTKLGLLVGTERKYRDAESLANGYVNLEEQNSRVEEENARLKEQLAQAKTVDDVLERMASRDATQSKDSALNKDMNLSQADLERVVEKAITGQRTKETRDANRTEANSKMQEAFGDKATEVFKAKATTPELVKVYQDLAETSPKDFLALFIEKSDATSNRSQAASNTSETLNITSNGGVQSENTPGTKAYYNKLRRDDPNKYYSRAIQQEIHKIVREQPDLYYGRRG